MPTDVDQQIARSTEFLDRTRGRYDSLSKRSRKRRDKEVMRRLGRVVAADFVILMTAIVVGMFVPLGMFGALGVMALLTLATLFFAIFPLVTPPAPEKFGQVPLKALPLQTEQWLERQRPALPAPAKTLVDAIGVQLETIAPQLATLDEAEPAAAEVRKLIGEQLPELLKGYARVPEPLRSVDRNGLTPNQQLEQGLQVIAQEIGEMSTQLAQGDLDSLATRGRYLQIKYRDDELG